MSKQLHGQIQIWDGTQWNSYGEYLLDASVELGDVSNAGSGDTGGDGVVKTLDFTLLNEGIVESQAYSPHLGQSDEEHDFQPMAKVVLSTAYTDVGVDPLASDWTPVFEGYLGDRIDIDGYKIECHCRDNSKVLQDYYVTEPQVFPKELDPTYIEIDGKERELYATPLVIQEILDYYSDEIGNITLHTPDLVDDENQWQFEDPEGDNYVFAIEYTPDEPWGIEYESLWDALQSLCVPSGHFLGFIFDEEDDEFKLTYKEPPIDKTTPDKSIEWSEDIKVHTREVSDERIRNEVKIVWGEPEELGEQQVRNFITVTDTDSQDRYGRRAMMIEEGDTRFITYEEQAILFGQHVINDLSEMTGTHSVDLFYDPSLKLFDLIEIYNPLIASSNFEIAVESIRHDLTFGDSPSFTTEIVGTNKVIGGRSKWLEIDARPGAKSPFDEEDISSNRPLGEPRNLQVESLNGGISISFAKPITNRWKESEIYVSKDLPVELIEDNLLTTTTSTDSEFYRGFNEGETYYVGVRHVDTSGNRSNLVVSDPVTIDSNIPYPDPDVVDIERIRWLADVIIIEYSLPENYDEIEIRLDDNFGAETEF